MDYVLWLPDFDPAYELRDDLQLDLAEKRRFESHIADMRGRKDWETGDFLFRPYSYADNIGAFDGRTNYHVTGNNNGVWVTALHKDAAPLNNGHPKIVYINAYTYGWTAIYNYLCKLYLEDE